MVSGYAFIWQTQKPTLQYGLRAPGEGVGSGQVGAIIYKAGKWCLVGINNELIGGSTTTCVIQRTVVTTDDGRGGRWAGLALMLVDPIVISTIHLDARSEEKQAQPAVAYLPQEIT